MPVIEWYVLIDWVMVFLYNVVTMQPTYLLGNHSKSIISQLKTKQNPKKCNDFSTRLFPKRISATCHNSGHMSSN